MVLDREHEGLEIIMSVYSSASHETLKLDIFQNTPLSSQYESSKFREEELGVKL